MNVKGNWAAASCLQLKTTAGRRLQMTDLLGRTMSISSDIAAELLESGDGSVGDRLVIMLPNGKDAGGWNRAGIELAVERVLKRSQTPRTWAWLCDFGLCLWSLPTKKQLLADGKPSQEAKAVCVRLVRD